MIWQRYVGIPFDVSRKRGTDCWGLVRKVYASELGIQLPEYADVSANDLLAVAKTIRKQHAMFPWKRISGTPHPFDVVLMRGISAANARAPVHVGIIVSGKSMLHIEESTGASAIVALSALTIRSRIIGFYRHADATREEKRSCCLQTDSVLGAHHSRCCSGGDISTRNRRGAAAS